MLLNSVSVFSGVAQVVTEVSHNLGVMWIRFRSRMTHRRQTDSPLRPHPPQKDT